MPFFHLFLSTSPNLIAYCGNLFTNPIVGHVAPLRNKAGLPTPWDTR